MNKGWRHKKKRDRRTFNPDRDKAVGCGHARKMYRQRKWNKNRKHSVLTPGSRQWQKRMARLTSRRQGRLKKRG